MSNKSCDNCQLKECDLSDCMSRKCGGGPTYPGHLAVNGICPLPRIGSKEWGWGVKCKPPFNEPVWHSPFTRIVVERYEEQEGVSEFNHRGCYIVIRPGCFGFNSVIYGFKNAFRFAELLARRDWRRENRGKK